MLLASAIKVKSSLLFSERKPQLFCPGLIKQFQLGSVRLTSAVSGEVEQQDVGAEVGQVVEGFQMLLQFPVGQFGLQDWCQLTEHVGVQRRRPAEVKRQILGTVYTKLKTFFQLDHKYLTFVLQDQICF